MFRRIVCSRTVKSLWTSGVAAILSISTPRLAAGQTCNCSCDSCIPRTLVVSDIRMNENGGGPTDFVSAGPSSGASVPVAHANQFVGPMSVTHVCVALNPTRLSIQSAEIRLSGDLGGVPGPPFFSFPFAIDTSCDLLGRHQVVDLTPAAGRSGVAVPGLFWVQVYYPGAINASGVGHQGVRAITGGTSAVQIQGFSWTSYQMTGSSRYVGKSAIIRPLHLAPAPCDIVATPTSGLVTSEAGLGASFTVVLAGLQPTSDVTVALTSDDPTEGVPTPASLVFTSLDWNVPKSVAVVGIDDAILDGDVTYRVHGAASSTDVCYDRKVMPTVSAVNRDDDGAGCTIAFDAATATGVGRDPRSAVVSDFDGDGDLDVATVNRGDNTVSLLLNAGTGTLGTATNYAVGNAPSTLVAADLDRDGDVDLATANSGAGTVSILRNNGNGSFAAATSFVAGSDPEGMDAADLDGDGDVDLVTANTNPPSSNLTLLRNSGNATFVPPIAFGSLVSPWSVAAGDLDGDGDIDLAAINATLSAVSFFYNTGTGSFTGPLDVNVSSTVPDPYAITLGDWDRDGRLDVALTNVNSNSMGVLRNLGGGSFSSVTLYPIGNAPGRLTSADLDHDGDLDLVVTAGGIHRLQVFANDGVGRFAAPTNLMTGNAPYAVAAGDLDGDGDVDLVSANSLANSVSVLLNRCVPNQLTVTRPFPSVAGTTNTFTATHATPGRTVMFFGGLHPGTTGVAGCPAISIGIRAARLVGNATASATGVATVSRNIPARFSGRTALVQAVEPSTCALSNLVTFVLR